MLPIICPRPPPAVVCCFASPSVSVHTFNFQSYYWVGLWAKRQEMAGWVEMLRIPFILFIFYLHFGVPVSRLSILCPYLFFISWSISYMETVIMPAYLQHLFSPQQSLTDHYSHPTHDSASVAFLPRYIYSKNMTSTFKKRHVCKLTLTIFLKIILNVSCYVSSHNGFVCMCYRKSRTHTH